MRVKGPNGLVLEIPDAVAETLVNSPSGDYVEVRDEPAPVKAPTKKAATKPPQK